MLPEATWRPSRLMARLTTPLVWPRSVRTFSRDVTSQSLTVRSSLAVASRRPSGKIGHGGDQAGMPGYEADFPADRPVPELDLGGDRAVIGAADRGEVAAVGREGQVVHAGGVAGEGRRPPRRSPRPRPGRSGPRPPRRCVRPSGEKATALSPPCVAREFPDDLAPGDVPEPDRCRRSPRWRASSHRARTPRRWRPPAPGFEDAAAGPASVSQRMTLSSGPDGGQDRAVGREGQGDVAQQPAAGDDPVQLLAGARVPDPDVAVVCRGDPAAVGREGQGSDPAGAVAERHLGVGRRCRPDLDRPIQAARRGQRALGPERHAVDEPGVAVEGGVRRRCPGPSAGRSCPRCRRRAGPHRARRPVRGRTPGGRSGSASGLPVAAVPEADGLVPAAGGHASAVRAEGDGIDEVDVPVEPVGDRIAADRTCRGGRRRPGWTARGAGRRAQTPRPARRRGWRRSAYPARRRSSRRGAGRSRWSRSR